MNIIDLSLFQDDFIIHYGCESHLVNANTFAQSLIKISEAIKLTDSIINPGYELEIFVEAVGIGSFRISIKSFKKSLSNIFSKSNIKAIALGLVAAFIWEIIQGKKDINVIVNDDSYVLEYENEKIILPKDAQEYYENIKKVDSIKKNIKENFDILNKDKKIKSFGFTTDINDESPKFLVSRNNFRLLSSESEIEEDKIERIEITKLLIVRAILKKSNRMWEFIWNGNPISAPIKDINFFDSFISHQIQIAPGDMFEVELKITMEKNEEIGMYLNKEYEVVKVLKHIPISKQQNLGI
jgi:hypothetical protein